DKLQRVSRGSFDAEDVLHLNWTSTSGHDGSCSSLTNRKPKTSRSTSVLQAVDPSWDARCPVALRTGPSENYLPGSFYKHSHCGKLRIGCNTELQKLEVEGYVERKVEKSPPVNGHHKPLKCVLNKDMNHSDTPISSHGGYAFPNDRKSCMQHDIRLNYEIRSHDVLHTIKQEPDDSPP
ncbi:hypothetical protein M9458_004891, partial [Cirrhinus mrigala]